MLYVRDTPTGSSGWLDVFLADTTNPEEPTIFTARAGRMVIDREDRTVDLVLENGTRHTANLRDPSKYEVTRFTEFITGLDPNTVFPPSDLLKGNRQGVTLTAPNLHPDWQNFDFATTLAKRLGKPVRVANDADVLTGTAQMVVGSIGVAKEEGVLWSGTQSSQAELAGEVGVAFQVYHWEVILKNIIDEIQNGMLGGTSYTLDLENGGLTIEYGQYELDDDSKALVDETIAAIVDGSIVPLPESTEPVATEEAAE